jgi:hypothetical protein
MFFSFGRKKRTRKAGGVKGKKPPISLRKACKRRGIKCTRKVGKRRFYKPIGLLKRQLKLKRKSVKRKGGKKRKTSRRRKISRRFRFGNAAAFVQPSNYGFNQKVEQAQGVLSQSSQVVTPANNINRPPGFGVDPASLPMYGVYRPFFTEQVPTQVGPNGLGFMGQPDGSLYPVGGPFSKFSSFGKRRRVRFGNKLKPLTR